jgi:carbon-monoxide dehydrogenase small subunit
MSRHPLTLTVNGVPVTREVEAHRTLLEVLRDGLDLRGAKEGCGAGECGTCTVLLDGTPVRACLVLAVEADGCAVTTIEGLGVGAGRAALGPDPIQQAFIDAGATQCGYCIPGFVLAAKALLDRSPDPADDDILNAFGGHLCRCTGYQTLFEAVRLAARRRAAG